jgi:hypothetical protein
MVPRLIGVLAVASILVFTSCSDDSDASQRAIREAVELELRLHPRATLIDIYKHFFQSRFGPGHMIENRDVAESYLRSEMAAATSFDGLRVQPLGVDSAFYRINLSLLEDSTLSENDLIDAFVESANSVVPPSLDEWIREWALIREVVETIDVELPGFERDSQVLDSLLAGGNVVVHHSDIFVREYDPHYRIVAKRFVSKLIDPIVEEK